MKQHKKLLINLVFAAVILAAAAVLQFMAKSGKLSPKTAVLSAFACAFVGVALARYGFYAAYAL